MELSVFDNKGWICVHRKILEWEWYSDINVSRLFLHLLLKANFEDKKWQGKVIKRGELITSLGNLSIETGLSVQQVRTAVDKLKSTNEITSKTTNQYTHITLCNYSIYQDKSENDSQPNGKQNNKPITNEQQSDNKPITNEQQSDNKPITTTKQDNKILLSNDNNIEDTQKISSETKIKTKKTKPPKTDISLNEFYEKNDRYEFKDFAKNYMFEKKYNYANAKLEFESFENHHKANGKKFKDWHAVFRKWVTSQYSRLSRNIHTSTEKDKAHEQRTESKFDRKFREAVAKTEQWLDENGFVDPD